MVAAAEHLIVSCIGPADIDNLVAASRKALAKCLERGDVRFFGLMLPDESDALWDIVVSAAWMDGDVSAGIRAVSGLMMEFAGPDDMLWVSRVVVLGANYPYLRALLGAFSVMDGEAHVKESFINGVSVKEAYVLRCAHTR